MRRLLRRTIVFACCLGSPVAAGIAQSTPRPASAPKIFTHADTLRGSNTPERAWWDVAFYDLHVRINPSDSSINGYNGITYRVVSASHPTREMQIDLMTPLEVDSMVQDGRVLTYRRDGNALFAILVAPQSPGTTHTITVYYHGRPRVAKKAPWDGGFVWTQDSVGHRWAATACQGFGASVWWPTKDMQADEPDSQRVAITVPNDMMDVSNGRLRSVIHNADSTSTYEWFVANPINNYDVAVNAGTFAHFTDTYQGERGPLTMDFWPLAYHLDTAKTQFQQAKPMLACFEHWFGPYPWYEDGYKLVETPYLGMEHQSAISYGNHYVNGYLGRDLSHTGIGLGWDFIIIHESGHEWFGNNITSQDIADMWVHESFTNYSEGLYTECRSGKDAGAAYVIGLRKNVANDAPIISHFGVNEEGSGDMYYKGANMLHAMRQIVNNDEKWRAILRGLNQTFWHQTVTGKQVEAYINRQSGIDFTTVFQQYLTTTTIPVLEYTVEGNTLWYRWSGTVPNFHMPIRVTLTPNHYDWITPTAAWRSAALHGVTAADFRVDENFYVIPTPVESRTP